VRIKSKKENNYPHRKLYICSPSYDCDCNLPWSRSGKQGRGARVGCRAATEVSVAKDAAARARSGAKLLLLPVPLSAPSPRIGADSAESPLVVWAVAGVYLPHPWRVV